MLRSLRANLTRWGIALLVVLIVGTFALWGIGDYLRTSSDPVVATVGGDQITAQEFRVSLQRDEAAYRRLLGDDYNPRMFEDPSVRRMLLQQLIDERLMVSDALRQGFIIPDQAVAEVIRTTELFQSDGQFNQERYLAMVRQQGRTVPGFERQLRQTMVTDQVRGGILAAAAVTDTELEQLSRIQGQSRDARFIVIDADTFAIDQAPSEEEISAYYENHADRFLTSQMVSIDYIALRLEEFASAIEVDEQSLRALYQERVDTLTEPERRQVRHIMLRLSEDAAATEVDDARAKLASIRGDLLGGADFADLARQLSEDPASADLGGDLGEVTRGDLAPEVEATAFALDKDEISEPVRSRFGLHLIQTTRIRAEQTPKFETMRETLAESYRQGAAQQAFFEQAELLQTISYENPESLDAAAAAVDRPIETTEPFSRVGGVGLLGHPEVVEQAFSDEVLVSGYNSDLLTPQPGLALVLRRKEHFPPQPIPLTEVREQILATLIDRAKNRQAREIGIALDNALAAGDDAEVRRLMETHGLSWQERRGIDRLNPGALVTPELARAIFRAPVTADGPADYQTLDLADGSYAIFAVTAVNEERTALSETDRIQLREEMTRLRANAILKGYIDAVRANADVEINAEAL